MNQQHRFRIGVIKPDFGATGGFERHLDGLLGALAGDEWEMEIVPVPIERVPRSFGIALEHNIRARHDEYFLWLAAVEAVGRLDLSRFDAVITTQPPTYLANHPRKLALFYHHARQFYDQADVFAQSGFVDPVIHRAATEAVRAVEADVPATVGVWLAGSAEVARRLREFWDVPDSAIIIHHAPPTSQPSVVPPYAPGGPVLCVGRFEWPKRQELLIAAASLAQGDWPVAFVGGGSRLDYARQLARSLAGNPTLELSDDRLWRNTAPGFLWPDPAADSNSPSPAAPLSTPETGDRIQFLGELDNEARDQAYAAASIVVTPTYREDYGLTVLEAMARARPVVVCTDGGGLTEFVRHGHNGLIIEPTPAAIAAAIDELTADPARAEAMGQAGRAVVADITWDRAVATVREGLYRVLGEGDGPHRRGD